MSYEKLVTVNYSSGYGGEFISTLLDCTLNDKEFNKVPNSNNEYEYIQQYVPLENGPGISFPNNPQLIFAIHKNLDVQSAFSSISQQENLSVFERYLRQVYNQYLYVKNSDDSVVKNNIIQMMQSMVPEPTENYNVLNFLNLKYNVVGLGLGDIFPGSNNIVLSTYNSKAHVLFLFLGWYASQSSKQNLADASIINFLIEKSKLYKSDPQFHNEYIIHVDKLTLERDEDYIKQVEDDLTLLIGKEVVFDRSLLSQYGNNNINIIKTQFNLNNSINVLDDSVLDTVASYLESQNV